MMRKLQLRITISWMVTAMIPLLVLIFYINLSMGPKVSIFLKGKDAINREVWQLDNWNTEEQIFRILDTIALKNPEKLLEDSTKKLIENQLDEENMRDMEKLKNIILIRRDKELFTLNNLETKSGIDLIKQLKTLEKPVLPKFGTAEGPYNQELFDKTGYIVQRQSDFYFSDQSKGSIIFLNKAVDISDLAAKFVTRYFKTIFGILLIFMTILSIHGTHRLSEKLKNLILATTKARDEDFNYRIKDISGDAFGLLGEEINHMLENLQKGQKYRRELEENRQNFISNLTHDLKTPLTAIKIHIDSIQDGLVTDPEKRDKYLNNIQTKLKDINTMLDELKIFNELDIGKEKYKFQEIDFNHYLQDLIEEFRYEVNPDKIKINYIIENNLSKNNLTENNKSTNINEQTIEYKTMIDPDKMKRLIVNIWNNTLKYVEKDKIEIEMKLFTDPNDLTKQILTIQDNGNGISSDQLESIFKQNYRIDPARNQDISGSGLGLAICKRIAEEHSGQIKALNTKGLTIQLELKKT